MHTRQLRSFILFLLAIVAFCLAAPTGALADNTVSWMTGYFLGYWPYEVAGQSPDYQYAFNLDARPTEYVGWYWECDEYQYYCEHHGQGYFTGGSVNGELSRCSGSDCILLYTFTGTVAPGGYITRDETYLGGVLTYWEYQYEDLRFDGYWSNGWRTQGDARGWQSHLGQEGSWFDLTTTSIPEPGTVLPFASGALVLAGFIRRKMW